METVDGVDRDLDRGVEADRVVGRVDVVVDRLRDADDGNAEIGHLSGDAERTLTADRDERVDVPVRDCLGDPFRVRGGLERIEPRRREDRPAPGKDPPAHRHVERHRVVLDDALPAVMEPDDVVAVGDRGATDDRPDGRVEAGTVSAAGKDS